MQAKPFAFLLAAALATAGAAHAQKAAETTNTPQRAGEASTMTGGAPNAKTTNELDALVLCANPYTCGR